jgi:hypothetical protein
MYSKQKKICCCSYKLFKSFAFTDLDKMFYLRFINKLLMKALTGINIRNNLFHFIVLFFHYIILLLLFFINNYALGVNIIRNQTGFFYY